MREQIGSIRIDKRCTVEVGGACGCSESSIELFSATTGSTIRGRCLIKRRSAGTEQRLTGNAIEPDASSKKRAEARHSRPTGETHRLTTLLPLNPPNLPPPDHLVDRAPFVQKF